ncbi:hypothetical protein [Salipiger bermudensis]|uniref:hypothetical protein n=1 Tax=Salipiger bermudensis TaxID=344736 RepID=UPI001CD38E65|nr:hypothetical protein [Salipiger bermudensis]MCA0962376.1 hypothetical protein [Salipiger bermudensis]
MSPTDSATLSRAFIADEGKDTTPRLWQMNHHRIKPIAAKLGQVLEPAERIEFYRLYLRRAKFAPAVPQGEIPLLIEGYRQLVPHDRSRAPAVSEIDWALSLRLRRGRLWAACAKPMPLAGPVMIARLPSISRFVIQVPSLPGIQQDSA